MLLRTLFEFVPKRFLVSGETLRTEYEVTPI